MQSIPQSVADVVVLLAPSSFRNEESREINVKEKDPPQVLAVYTAKAAFLNWESGVEVDKSFAATPVLSEQLDAIAEEDDEGDGAVSKSKRRYKKGKKKSKKNRGRRTSLVVNLRTNEDGESSPVLTAQQWDTINSLPQFCLPDYSIIQMDPLIRPRFGHHISTDIAGNRLFSTYVAISGKMENAMGESVAVQFVVVLLSSSIAFKSQLKMLKCFADYMVSLNIVDCWRQEVLQLSIYATRCPLPPADLILRFPIYNKTITVTSPIPLSMSYGELPVWCVLHFLDSSSLVNLISAFLNERSIVVLSSSTMVIPQFIASLLVLLYPLRFVHTVIPVLPDEMLGFLEAPSVFIIGCHAKHKKSVKSIPELFVVDLDSGTSCLTEDLKLNRLPKELENLLLEYHGPLVSRAVILQMSQEQSEEELQFKLIQTAIHLFQKLLKELLWEVVNWVDHQQKSFNERQFLDEVDDKKELPFYTEFARTNLVEDLVQRLLDDPDLVDDFLTLADDSTLDTIDSSLAEADLAVYNFPSIDEFPTDQYLDKCASELLRSFSNLSPHLKLRPGQMTPSQLLMLASNLFALDGQWGEAARAYYTLANVQAENFQYTLFRDYIFPQISDEMLPSLGPELKKLVCEIEEQGGADSRGVAVGRRKSRAPIPVHYITQSLPSGPLKFQEFKKTVRNLGIANFNSNIMKAFQILANDKNTKKSLSKLSVPEDLFRQFIDMWKAAEQLRDVEERPNIMVNLEPDEEIMKISPRMCNTSISPGWLILTTQRLLVAPASVGKSAISAVLFSEIVSIEFTDEQRLKVATVKLLYSMPVGDEVNSDSADGLTMSRRQMSQQMIPRGKRGRRTALSITNTFQMNTFKFDMNYEREETFLWYKMVKEMHAGYTLSSAHKFPELQISSIESIRLFDCLVMMYQSDVDKVINIVHNFTRLAQAGKDRSDMDPLSRMLLLRKISPGAQFKVLSMTSCTVMNSAGTYDILLLLGCDGGTLHVYSYQNEWKWLRKVNFGGAPITAIRAAIYSGQLWMGRGDGQCLVVDANNNFAGRRQLSVHAGSVSAMALSANESIVCSISVSHEVVFISAPTLAVLYRIAGLSSPNTVPAIPSLTLMAGQGHQDDASLGTVSLQSQLTAAFHADSTANLLKNRHRFLRARPMGNSFVVLLQDEIFRVDATGNNSSRRVDLKQLAPEAQGFFFDVSQAAQRIIVVAKLEVPTKKKEDTKVIKESIPGDTDLAELATKVREKIKDQFTPAERFTPAFVFDAENLAMIEEFLLETNGEIITDVATVEDDNRAEIWLSRADGQVDVFPFYPVEQTALPSASRVAGGLDTRSPSRSLSFYQKASIRFLTRIDLSSEANNSDGPYCIVACMAKTLDFDVVALWKADIMLTVV